MKDCYLLLGGNQGNRVEIQDTAINLIKEEIGEVITVSSDFESEPWGFCAEQNFLNKVVHIRTELLPEEVLRKIAEIEKKSGRVRGNVQYASRTLDIDILFYSDNIIKTQDLTVPHKEFCNRKFAIKPMLEIAPGFIHPSNGLSIQEIYETCTDNLWVEKLQG